MDPETKGAIAVASVIVIVATAFALFGGGMEWRATLDTTQLSEGTHTVQAVAYDEAGNVAYSEPITIFVDNEASMPESPTIKPAVVLAWKKPTDSVQIKVKESMVSYPTTITVVRGEQTAYTGTGSSYTDKTPSTYYGIFSKDSKGRWSKPALVLNP